MAAILDAILDLQNVIKYKYYLKKKIIIIPKLFLFVCIIKVAK